MSVTLRMKMSTEGARTVSEVRACQSFNVRGKKKQEQLSLVCAAGVQSVSLALSSSRSCGLVMEFGAFDHFHSVGDLIS